MKKRVKECPYLPEEIITNILTRLPVKSLVRFQLVCKKWKDTISSRHFVDLHQRSSIPVILVALPCSYGFDHFAVDKWWDLSRKKKVTHRFTSCSLAYPCASLNRFSHSGLIVLNKNRFWDPRPTYVILNPARPCDECVKINYSYDFPGIICAVYYHPTLDEYCALWRIRISGCSALQPELIQYKLLTLGSNPSFRMISDAFTYRIRYDYPLLINDCLYWMLESERGYNDGHNDILEFDVTSEEFMVLPCPIPLTTKCNCHETHLLNSDGNLSFILNLSSRVTIWVLKDHELQMWTTTKYTINLDTCRIDSAAGIIALVDGMLAYEYQGILFVCNLREGTVKKYRRKYGDEVLFLSHQMSLPSLRNCKAELYIDKQGEVSL